MFGSKKTKNKKFLNFRGPKKAAKNKKTLIFNDKKTLKMTYFWWQPSKITYFLRQSSDG
jgi:hypothetical protein